VGILDILDILNNSSIGADASSVTVANISVIFLASILVGAPVVVSNIVLVVVTASVSVAVVAVFLVVVVAIVLVAVVAVVLVVVATVVVLVTVIAASKLNRKKLFSLL
ncbi:13569_t:CDS:1, partial [Cetraspora pellucida]